MVTAGLLSAPPVLGAAPRAVMASAGNSAEAAAMEVWLDRDLSVSSAEAALAAAESAAQRTNNPKMSILASEAAHWLAFMLRDAGVADDVRKETFLRGVEHAKRAQELGPDLAGGYFWEAANTGRAAEITGIAASAWRLPRLAWLIARTDALEPGYWDAATDRARGVIIAASPDWLIRVHGVDLDDAEHYFQRSLEAAPERLDTLVFMAQLYFRRGERERGMKTLRQVVAAPPASDRAMRPWNALAKEDAKRMLAEQASAPSSTRKL